MPAAAPRASPNENHSEVPLENQGGTFVVPVTINDAISLKFTIDSGASYVTIPSDVASTLVRAGTITAADYVGSDTFTLADGSQVPSPEFRIKSLRVGNLVLHDVVASITSNNGSLLLGQTFLTRLKSWSIDNNRHVLSLEGVPGGAEATVAQIETNQLTASNLGNNTPATADIASIAPLVASSEETVTNYFAAWSNANDPQGLTIGKYYGDPVSFYGKRLDLNDLMMKQKIPFARRWPIRSYTVEANSLRIKCAAATRTCTAVGTVDWRVANSSVSRHASGTARFSLLLVDGRIMGEGGRVLSRN